MKVQNHFDRLSRYYKRTDFLFNTLLWGSKHFGFYPEKNSVSEKNAQLLMQDLVAKKLKLSKEKKVLDAGCGNGLVSIYLSKKYACFIKGITILPFEAKKARESAIKNGIVKLVDYFVMDYSNIAFQNGYFDAIYTTESLSHSTDIKKTLNEFFRVLKPGGRIALFEYSIAEDGKFTNNEMESLNKVIFASAMDGLKEFRHDRFVMKLKEAGFKDTKAENITDNVRPSLNRLRRIFFIPYLFVKVLHLPSVFPNLISANEFYKMSKKDLIRYNIFTATK
jgi:ubiquinone/menaquinone biosynthesis C-methylase UbiE